MDDRDIGVDGQDFVFGDEDPNEWIGATEGHRLPGRPSNAKLYRWRTEGAIAHDGKRVYLPTFMFSGRKYTTLAGYHWFRRRQRGY